MDASCLLPADPLPEDVPILQGMVVQLRTEVVRLRGENAELRQKLDAALKHRFGQRSERTRTPKEKESQPTRQKRTPHGRGQLPEHLERREVIHDLTEAEKICPCCGKTRECIGEQVAEQLDMEPIRFFVLRTRRKTYACQHCGGRDARAEQATAASVGQQQPDAPDRASEQPLVIAQAEQPQCQEGQLVPETTSAGQQQPTITSAVPQAVLASPVGPPPGTTSTVDCDPVMASSLEAGAVITSAVTMPSNDQEAQVEQRRAEAPTEQPAAGNEPKAQSGARPVIQTAGPAQVGPIAKGLCGPGLLAHVITAKYADHIPLHRLAEQVSRSGVTLAESTLGGWMAQAATLLEPLYKLMKERLLHSRVLHSDDTGVKLRVVDAKRTKKSHMWVYIGEMDYPYVVYDFRADYKKEGPHQFLKGYKGYLQADALAQYEGLYGEDKVKHVCCWAHARRKFVAAREGGDDRAEVGLTLIGKLYDVERKMPPLLPAGDGGEHEQQRRQREDQRRKLRQEQVGPILQELKEWLDAQKSKVLPKSSMGEAIGYAWNNWEALTRYQEQGYLAIDNNLSERTLRAIAVGRNNWGVIGSETGGKTAAVLYTMTGTCKLLRMDPFEYLREGLAGIFALGEKPGTEQLMQWLPDRWLVQKKERPPPGAQTE